MRLLLVLTSTIALLCACSGGGPANPPGSFSNGSASPALFSQQSLSRTAAPEAVNLRRRSVTVYTLSNGASRNKVVSFVSRRGALKYDRSFDTGGLGDPSVAGTVQGAIGISPDERFLFGVNAGSNEITSFRIGDGQLQLVGKVASRGTQPVSLAIHRDSLFVLNAGSSSISGFHITRNGRLRPIPNSTAPLSGTGVGPAEIAFDPSGKVLVVTEKSTNDIDTYSVVGGVPMGPAVHASSGMTPFGFAFAPHSENVVVSEAFGGASGEGAASSYSVTPPSTLMPVSASVPDGNTAPCWVVITQSGIAFTSNTGSNTISAYSINAQGSLKLINGVSAQTGTSPTDLALSPNGRELFVLNLKSRTIGAYEIGTGGTLTSRRGARALPPSALGLVALPSND